MALDPENVEQHSRMDVEGAGHRVQSEAEYSEIGLWGSRTHAEKRDVSFRRKPWGQKAEE